MGQAKSNGKEILRFALNDKLIVNCQWLIVMRGTRFPSAEEHPPSPPFKGGGRAKRSVGEKGIASRRRAVSRT
ncbi:hypothetical protein CLI86_03345 [Tannerella forsythia]|uniref:Uncharacterized protein n=1 Tax=Tannerella forsythia TaxID=28112 RepID=A0A2A6EAA6_TANFO|nr:hypothetical protein CLI86_03345 [Tannerella forsythia]